MFYFLYFPPVMLSLVGFPTFSQMNIVTMCLGILQWLYSLNVDNDFSDILCVA